MYECNKKIIHFTLLLSEAMEEMTQEYECIKFTIIFSHSEFLCVSNIYQLLMCYIAKSKTNYYRLVSLKKWNKEGQTWALFSWVIKLLLVSCTFLLYFPLIFQLHSLFHLDLEAMPQALTPIFSYISMYSFDLYTAQERTYWSHPEDTHRL